MKGRREIDYISLLFDRHEVIYAEGTPTESFRPGHVAMAGFEPRIRDQIYAIYPRLREEPVDGLGPTARLVVTFAETEALLKSHRQAAGRQPKVRRLTSIQESNVVPLYPV